jgi:hypothetical protein
MRVRQLERLLIDHGVGAAKIDAVTRRLREIKRLPTGGRGRSAPTIGPREAASILLGLAGSTKGAEADYRLKKLETLRSAGAESPGEALIDAVARSLQRTDKLPTVKELRVARTTRRATLVFTDGRVEEFRPSSEPKTDWFFVEGVVPGELLNKIANALSQATTGGSTR